MGDRIQPSSPPHPDRCQVSGAPMYGQLRLNSSGRTRLLNGSQGNFEGNLKTGCCVRPLSLYISLSVKIQPLAAIAALEASTDALYASSPYCCRASSDSSANSAGSCPVVVRLTGCATCGIKFFLSMRVFPFVFVD